MSSIDLFFERLRMFGFRILSRVVDSPRIQRRISWGILIVGLFVWIGVQGNMMVVPLWTRAMPPEPDDSVTYVLKTRQMEECPRQDCPALEDLRAQFQCLTENQEVVSQRSLAGSRIFPLYHPLFSVALLGVEQLGIDLETAYKVLWTAGPVLFALTFAYLLVILFGPSAAGLALLLLAFKVFPDTGLGRVVPSNVAMAIAVALWARIVSTTGDAPWSMGVGGLALVAMHPIGRIYAVMAAIMAICLPGFRFTLRRTLPLIFIGMVVALAFANVGWFRFTGVPASGLVSGSALQVHAMMTGAVETTAAVLVELVRLHEGLWGVGPVFLGTLVLGLFLLPGQRRSICLRFIAVYLLCLGAVLLYRSNHPGDVIFRMWIPLAVVLFGVVASAICYVSVRSLTLICRRFQEPDSASGLRSELLWTVVLLGVLVGYCVEMTSLGMEHVLAATQQLKQRQPIRVAPSQPRTLLSEARPGDRVLYTSMILMPYYFVRGAMNLGAVYYHPAMVDDECTQKWLSKPDLRFAVAYNPTVYHPSFDGVQEHRWWITSPEYKWSPIAKRRKHAPIAVEGHIPTSRFSWVEITPRVKEFPRLLRLRLKNPGNRTRIGLSSRNDCGAPLAHTRIERAVPPKWSGWLEMPLTDDPGAKSFRILFPDPDDRFMVTAVVLGNDPGHWPWAQKADMTFMPRENGTGPITVSFDPVHILPPPLNKRKISILNDEGSSVLFKIGPSVVSSYESRWQ